MDYYTRFSAQASLAVVGVQMRQMKIWETIEQKVHIRQKTIKHRPLDKLLDAFMNILAGGRGLVEINTRIEPDEGLQKAFGRQACADQSTISDTLGVCTQQTVNQMQEAMQMVYRVHSQGYNTLTTGATRCWMWISAACQLVVRERG
jgi:hypothetical protein